MVGMIRNRPTQGTILSAAALPKTARVAPPNFFKGAPVAPLVHNPRAFGAPQVQWLENVHRLRDCA